MGEDFAMAEQPVQILPKTADSGVLKLGGNDIAYNSLAERRLLVHEIKETERRHAGIVGSVHRLKYPIALASSMSADAILTAKYELNATFVTYEEALSAAMARNGYLLQIKDAEENLLVRDWLKEKNDDVILPEGFDESNNSVPYVWLGATDNEDTNGTIFDTENNLTTQTREINASEGNWKWLNGEEWSYEKLEVGYF